MAMLTDLTHEEWRIGKGIKDAQTLEKESWYDLP